MSLLVTRMRTTRFFRARWLASICLLLAGCVRPTPAPYEIPPAHRITTQPSAAAPFWWGISTSSYQIEEPPPARAFSTDWDLFCRQNKKIPARDDRIASLSRFERDIAALKSLGVTHYRFSIEWARVEPARGKFDEAALAQYTTLAKRLAEEKITPIVCLWHFTFPDWLTNFDSPDKHGWLHPEAREAWKQYVTRVSRAICPYVRYFAPQNEPNSYAAAISLGLFPPGRKLGEAYYHKTTRIEIEMFRLAAETIRQNCSQAQILSVQSVIHWQRDPFDLLGLWYGMGQKFDNAHLDGIADTIDMVGFNYYQSELASPMALALQSKRKGDDVSDLGWIIDPAGLEREIVRLSQRYHKPLVILENGVADAGDTKRHLYLLRHLLAVRRTRDAGYDVRGYFHWSLMDNYEWMHGYGPKFGLFAVDEKTKELIPKQSAMLYKFLIQQGYMDPVGTTR